MELLVYKASAGSGKTFTLAVEYIKLLILNPRAYQQILAVTFTNKATAEMKERILSQLYGIWTHDKESEPYLSRIIAETGRAEAEVCHAAGIALNYMLHDYSRFRVETIDSFFQSVMRNLARELELSPNLNIELNNTDVLSDAVDSMIEKLGPTSPALVWLLDYIEERIADDKRWNVSEEVKSFGRNIFDEGYIERGERLRERLRDPNILRDYRRRLCDMETEALEQMRGFYDQFVGVLEANGLTPDELKNGSKGIGSYFRKLNEGKLSDDTFNATASKCLNDEANWAAKSSPRFFDIVTLAATTLMPLLGEAEKYRPTNNRIVNSCRLSAQHLNKLRLLANIDEEVRTLNRDNNRFLLSDTNALLHRLVRDGDSSFVFEKIGANIRNVMIDEFQDTSRMQWGNFRLLLLEGLSQGADSLIVGDVKQSIYRWRNGDWGILNALNSRIEHFPIRTETLKTNRRSEANIIRFNNRIFTAAVDYLNLIYKDSMQEECQPLLDAYADVQQKSSRTEQRGYIKVSFVEPDAGHDYTEQTLLSMGREVERLQESGVRLSDIAILVRKNKNIPRIADYFDKQLHCRVVSDEAFRLDASLAVSMMVDALRILSNPEDRIARAQLISAYQLQVLGTPTDLNSLLLGQQAEEFLPEEFVANRPKLRLMPLYELLEELFRIFSLNQIEEQDAYLFAFFDAVTDYLQSHSSDTETFIRFWDETLSSKTIPSGEVEGIRIFSIHKSKGLEFHTVLLPFCDWKMENETNGQLVWCTPTEAPFNELDIVPVNYSSAMAESVYKSDYLQERLQLWVDNLNLLYVAFTRAGKNLLVWCKRGQRGTMSELLTQSLPAVARKEGIEWTDDDAYEEGSRCPSETRTEKVSTNKLTREPEKLPVRMESIQPEIEFRQSNRSADFIKGIAEEDSDQRFINRGRLLHTLFSVIESSADIDAAIERLYFEGVIGNKEEREEVRSIARNALKQPEVQHWYSGKWRLFNECAIIYRQEGVLQTRRPDRVMMKDSEVVVVDFKFGKQNKKYNEQVRSYMQLLVQMGYSNITGYLWYVDEGEIVRV